ncbi:MAG: thioredoxin family protein [Thiogranum sp.]
MLGSQQPGQAYRAGYVVEPVTGPVAGDEEPGITAKYRIRSISTLKVFNAAQALDSRTGLIPADQLDGVIAIAADS